MELYDRIRNITGKNNEEELIDAISITRQKLNKLDEERTCKIYSSYLLRELLKKHIPSRLINTLDLGSDYEHEFILVNKGDKTDGYFISDLTFSQFHNQGDQYVKLLKDGYQSIDNKSLSNYLKIVSKDNYLYDISLDDLFFSTYESEIKKRKF